MKITGLLLTIFGIGAVVYGVGAFMGNHISIAMGGGDNGSYSVSSVVCGVAMIIAGLILLVLA